MDISELRNRFLKFYGERNHAIIPSAPIIPESDPTTLFTGSGMQPLLPYFLGETHPAGSRVTDSQMCFRAEDIPEVGDNRHTTFFEMLGNWSFGDYFKAEQLSWYFQFLTEDLGIPADKIYVTAFAGEEKLGLPRDTEAVEIWKKLFAKKGVAAKEVVVGASENGAKVGMQVGKSSDGLPVLGRIFLYDGGKNWWSRAGAPGAMPGGEPGGPDSEVFFDFGTPHNPEFGEHCHPNCDCGRFLEIGNSVFMEYKKDNDGKFLKLPKRNVDFGGGLERTAAALSGNPDIFKLDVFKPVIELLEAAAAKSSGQVVKVSYDGVDEKSRVARKKIRIIADHLRAGVFMLAGGILPGNKEQGYILRRLLRRAYFSARELKITGNDWIIATLDSFAESYGDYYTTIVDKQGSILLSLTEESEKFSAAIESGLKIFKKIAVSGKKEVNGEEAFNLFTTHGFPLELTFEVAAENGLSVDEKGFQKLMESHRTISRAGSEQKFKGGLKDTSEVSVRYHTATHLLHKALREVLGNHVAQKGSNITPERLRFDFSHPKKLSDEEKKKVEEIVNGKIKAALSVNRIVMSKEEAEKSDALHFFGEKYGDQISIYYIGDSFETAYSKEFCGGPHVSNTSELGQFKIQKDEAVSAGVRRIKAVLN